MIAQFEKYHSLALACAVVFDKTMTIDHPTEAVESGTQVRVDPLERYLWYMQKNEKGKLAAPVHHANARDLVWVVCAPVSTSELDWAISKLSGHRKNWGRNYGEIEYLMERAVNGENPYKEYTFAEILKHGGICGDQTYYCVNTARAQGIPAMGLSGETDAGGHAWAGLKIDDREWTTTTGRIGGVSKGEAYNPQTNESITEQEILTLERPPASEPGHHPERFPSSVACRFFRCDKSGQSQRRDHPPRQQARTLVHRNLASALHAVRKRDGTHRRARQTQQPRRMEGLRCGHAQAVQG